MTRSSVRQAIDFQGVIEGCPDHQWLLTDALYETTKEVSTDTSPRWIVLSHVVDSSSPDAPSNRYHYQARDREEGWTLSATSPSTLAQRIRQHQSSPNRTQP